MNQSKAASFDFTKLKPLICKKETSGTEVPKLFNPLIKRCVTPISPKSPVTATRLTPIDKYEEKLAKIGNIEYVKKQELINNFDTEYFSFMFWTCVQTKTLGTFLVVKTPDTKMHFISMRKKLIGCNFQYEYTKKCICTKACDGCEFDINEVSFYEFPEEVIILTPEDAYEIPNILSKM